MAALRAAILDEVAAALTTHGHLVCVPTVECEDGAVTLTVRVTPELQSNRGGDNVFRTLELFGDLERVCDVATMRALCARYDLDPQWLEKALNDRRD